MYVVIPDPHRGSINEIAKLREHCPVVVPPQAEFATAMIDTENRGCQSYSTESGGSGSPGSGGKVRDHRWTGLEDWKV